MKILLLSPPSPAALPAASPDHQPSLPGGYVVPRPTPVRLFASIDELPVARHIAFQQQSIVASEIGCTERDVELRFQRLHTLLAAGRVAEASEEAAHLHGTYVFALRGTALDALTLATLVADVDGEATDDLTPEGLERTVGRLLAAGLTEGQVRETLAEVKKNFAPN